MTLKLKNLSYKYSLSTYRNNGQNIMGKKKVTEYFGTPTNTEFRKKKKNKKNK